MPQISTTNSRMSLSVDRLVLAVDDREKCGLFRSALSIRFAPGLEMPNNLRVGAALDQGGIHEGRYIHGFEMMALGEVLPYEADLTAFREVP